MQILMSARAAMTRAAMARAFMLLALMLLAVMPLSCKEKAQDTQDTVVKSDRMSIEVWIAQVNPGAKEEDAVLLMADLGAFAGRVTDLVLETDIGTARFQELPGGSPLAGYAAATMVVYSEVWFHMTDLTVISATGNAGGSSIDLAQQVTFLRPFLPAVWLRRQGPGGMTLGEAVRLLGDLPLEMGPAGQALPILTMEEVMKAAIEIYSTGGNTCGIFTPADSGNLPRSRPYIVLFRDGAGSGFSVMRPSRQGADWDTVVFSIKSRTTKRGLNETIGNVPYIGTENGWMGINEAIRKNPVLRRAYKNNKGRGSWNEVG
jgi:hypothetical protein